MKRDDQIRKAGYDILGNEGLEELHARTVAKAVGINHATVHYYFPHREDLIVAVAEYALHQLIRDRMQFQQGARTNKDKLEAELALAEAYCRPQSRFVKVLGGLYVAGINSPVIRQKLAAIWDEWHSLVAKLVGKASDKGKLQEGTPYADPELLVATFFGLGLASHMLGDRLDGQKQLDKVFSSMFGP